MRVCVIGGSGYMGTHLVKKLVDLGHQVRVLDNFMYGKNEIEGADYIEGDIQNDPDLEKAIKDTDFTCHLAGLVGEPLCQIDRRLATEINLFTTPRIVHYCNRFSSKLVYSSSASVYGNQPNNLLVENSSPMPLGAYAETRAKSEEIIMGGSKTYLMFRIGTMFGPSKRMRYDLVVNKFIAQALRGEKITVSGGNQFRPFIHVEDAAEAFIKGMEMDLKGIYNLLWNNMTLMELANFICTRLGTQSEIRPEQRDFRNYRVSNLKLLSTGIEPRRDIYDAINGIAKLDLDISNPIYSNEAVMKTRHNFISQNE